MPIIEIVNGKREISHKAIDAMIAEKLNRLDSLICQESLDRWYLTTLRAEAFHISMEIIDEIISCGKEAEVAANFIKQRVEYASPFVRTRLCNWSYRQLQISIDGGVIFDRKAEPDFDPDYDKEAESDESN